ncbi:MAG: helix-turn-helix domain-containing protein [Veillonella sp.]|uniref:helix-turn-helix domain-containing protein n=1 Tax=Veillonella sp. TaxID=1926307 RepID=UPI00206476C5|nr:helix-turn-helix domain-containing protein [Veillonella sp.]MBS5717325.1 helix-turn-helix domain-containing protein [Veillonella sp.]DAP61523.1 MAG TPA: helix-turn-helix domain protein [Caudoviricetes sp.]
MKLTYTVDETAEVLGISKSSVYNLRNAGTIHQLTKLPGVLFSVKEVQEIAGLETEINAVNYRALKVECERLAEENAKLKNDIKKIASNILTITGEL